jgi:RecA-family ATPase
MKQIDSRCRVDLVRLSDVQTKEVEWLWYPYIPSGKLTMLEGDPESGKTFAALHIAARITRGAPLPNEIEIGGVTSDPGNVIYLTGEDDLGDTSARVSRMQTAM